MRTGGGLGSIGSGHLVQEPVRGRAKALLVLLTVKALQSVCRFEIENVERMRQRPVLQNLVDDVQTVAASVKVINGRVLTVHEPF